MDFLFASCDVPKQSFVSMSRSCFRKMRCTNDTTSLIVSIFLSSNFLAGLYIIPF